MRSRKRTSDEVPELKARGGCARYELRPHARDPYVRRLSESLLPRGDNVNPTNHVYFADSTGTSRSFQFAPGPRVLNGMRVYSTTPGTFSLSDDTGQTFTRPVSTGSLQLVTTGWTRPATTVTVSFTNGWDLGVDDITYGTAR